MDDLKMFDKFLEAYPPCDGLVKPQQEFLESVAHIVPAELIEFWKRYGFGCYGNGIIQVVDPEKYSNSLYTWLGKRDVNKIPIMITAFGNILYYRGLGEKEDDVCLLDIHNRRVEVLSYSFKEFFEVTAANNTLMSELLDEELYNQAVNIKGELTDDEIFYFVPALIAGGKKSVQNISKGDAVTHQQLLFQLGL